jgi:hypothetical protein
MPKVQINAVDYDSFIAVTDADIYLAGDVARSTGWALRNADAKARGLISATRMLVSLPWIDPAPEYDTAPQIVQDVTAMLAADLLAAPRLFADASGNSNIKTAKAGSAQVEFFRPIDGGPPIPRALWNLLLGADLVSIDSGTVASDAPFVSGSSDGCRPEFGRYPWDWPIAASDYG